MADHVDHVYYEDRRERRRNWRTRHAVRNGILTFRRGVYLVLEIVEALLVVEFLIRLFGLSPVNYFVAFMNALTLPLLVPFGNISTLIAPYYVIDWSIIFAILLYGLLAYILIALFESGIRAAYRRRY